MVPGKVAQKMLWSNHRSYSRKKVGNEHEELLNQPFGLSILFLKSSSANYCRLWIMAAVMSSTSRNYFIAIQMYTRILEILEWGREFWKDVALEDRGCIFEPVFIRGVRRLQMNAIREVCI